MRQERLFTLTSRSQLSAGKDEIGLVLKLALTDASSPVQMIPFSGEKSWFIMQLQVASRSSVRASENLS